MDHQVDSDASHLFHHIRESVSLLIFSHSLCSYTRIYESLQIMKVIEMKWMETGGFLIVLSPTLFFKLAFQLSSFWIILYNFPQFSDVRCTKETMGKYRNYATYLIFIIIKDIIITHMFFFNKHKMKEIFMNEMTQFWLGDDEI